MHPFDCPPLPLEEGIISLKSLYDTTPGPESPPDQAFLWLLTGACRHGLETKSAALPAAGADARRQLALLQRLDRCTEVRIARLQREYGVPESAMLHACLLLETAAAFAMRLEDGPVRRALHFMIPEFLDELYRLSNLSVLLGGSSGQELLACQAEIMPGRPLIACHRHPYDDTAAPLKAANETEILALHVLLAALNIQQAFCLFAPALISDPDARALFGEIACVAQGHAARFLGLLPVMPPLRRALAAQYACAYLFFSRAETETRPDLKMFWEAERNRACSRVRKLWEMTGGDELPAFPPPLTLGQSKGYVRDTLEALGETAKRAEYVPVAALAPGADFFRYQKRVCGDGNDAPSHRVVQKMIEKQGCDDRFEIAPHPVEALRNRTRDNIHIAR